MSREAFKQQSARGSAELKTAQSSLQLWQNYLKHDMNKRADIEEKLRPILLNRPSGGELTKEQVDLEHQLQLVNNFIKDDQQMIKETRITIDNLNKQLK
jgi:hypothetical protein